MASTRSPALRLAAARAVAWALLLAGWVGLGSLAFALTPRRMLAFALVAGWLLMLGLGARLSSLRGLPAMGRRVALLACAGVAAGALHAALHGGAGLPALALAALAWAALAAGASGVVRSLRLGQPQRPTPPVQAAAAGAVLAALALLDPLDLPALTLRLQLLLLAAALALALLQPADGGAAAGTRCRAGLFDCSLPAWPTGAWRELGQWPTLLAGLAMLPMMAGLPLMVAWCGAGALPPAAMVGLHLAAMFLPALLVRGAVAAWPAQRLAGVCAASLGAGALAALLLPTPWDLLLIALSHGMAWGLAWAGQLWAPERRGQQGSSPLRAAAGYALATLGFGLAVEAWGSSGVLATHALLGSLAVLALLVLLTRRRALRRGPGLAAETGDGSGPLPHGRPRRT